MFGFTLQTHQNWDPEIPELSGATRELAKIFLASSQARPANLQNKFQPTAPLDPRLASKINSCQRRALDPRIDAKIILCSPGTLKRKFFA